ncbi:phage tail assembly chaperone [Providencia rustigianii]|uniref:phage tail assembly chaperone n=1 Tax=Providencia rustigianii TaxID=158850 RepID=UPI002243A6B1|nr:phage tail assembly chaperone [Providencia rustigianii]
MTKAKKSNLRDLALSASQSFRTKKVIVPEWGDLEVTVREPSIQARIKCSEFVREKEGEELTSTQKALRNIEGDAVIFINILLNEDGSHVFTEEDLPALLKTYGPVHARLLSEAFALTISVLEAEKK